MWGIDLITQLLSLMVAWLTSLFGLGGGGGENPRPPLPDPVCLAGTTSLVLANDQLLYSSQDPRWICSPNGYSRMGLTESGDLTIWKNGGQSLHWSGFTFSPEPVYLKMQGDGNLVMRKVADQSLVWMSTTFGNNGLGAQLTVTDEGMGQITIPTTIGDDPSTGVLWQSKGCGHWPARDGSREKQSNNGTQINGDGSSTKRLVDTTTLYGKVLVGYVGWHDTYCTGQWRGWSNQRRPGPQTYEFEMWPEMDEYYAGEGSALCGTDLRYTDGSVAALYSSYDWRTVDLHVRWLADYDIDGLILQYFVGTFLCFRTTVLRHVRASAEKYGRAFAVQLDISNTKEADVYNLVVENWKFLVDHEQVTTSPQYLRHKGRPLLGLWGLGFKNRPGEPDQVLRLLDWLQNSAEERYRVTLMGGVPEGWQNLTRNAKPDLGWAAVYRTYDVISPWAVGRYKNTTEADAFRRDYTDPNLAELQPRDSSNTNSNKDYLPVVFPGFSWSYRNIKENTSIYPFNQIPRQGGHFLWRQMYNAIDAFRQQTGTTATAALYVATLDEVNEGTAIYKLGTDRSKVPVDVNFVTLDVDEGYSNLPSDWYLQIVGRARAAIEQAAANGNNNNPFPIGLPTISRRRQKG